MTRALHFCRWCGQPPAPSNDPLGRGRPPTFCTDEHRATYRRIFGAPRWDGAVTFTTTCRHGCDPSTTTVPGPVHAPGAWADLDRQVGLLIHGHPVEVTVSPAESGGTSTIWANELMRSPS